MVSGRFMRALALDPMKFMTTSVLGLLAALGLYAWAHAVPLDLGGRPRPSLCDFILVPQYDPGGCVSAGNPSCDGSGQSCCAHFHHGLAWNKAVHWIKPTGLAKGPPIKKYYNATTSACVVSARASRRNGVASSVGLPR